jgi:hypothetical protein
VRRHPRLGATTSAGAGAAASSNDVMVSDHCGYPYRSTLETPDFSPDVGILTRRESAGVGRPKAHHGVTVLRCGGFPSDLATCDGAGTELQGGGEDGSD